MRRLRSVHVAYFKLLKISKGKFNSDHKSTYRQTYVQIPTPHLEGEKIVFKKLRKNAVSQQQDLTFTTSRIFGLFPYLPKTESP